MKRRTGFTAAVLFSAYAALAGAVDLTMGNSGIASSGGDTTYGTGTLIDLNNPASATGTITHIEIAWAGAPCGSAGKIKVFHRAGNTLTIAAEEAFSVPAGPGPGYSFDLTSPLPVHQGDLIGVYNAGTCGGPKVSTNPFAGRFLLGSSGDLTTPLTFDPALDENTGGLGLYATGVATQYRAGVIPGVGSGPGLNGANFKTSLQMIAPAIGGDVAARLVFHPAGAGGSVSDLFMDVPIAQGHSVAFDDVVAAMGQTGFGTLDVIVAADSAIPVTLARIYNDQGSAGQSGLGEEMVAEAGPFSFSGQIVPAGFTGYLSAPVDPAKTRLNIGVRTLDSEAFVSFELRDSAGNLKATSQSDFPPNFFNQFHAEDMFGMALAPNDVVEVSVSTGSAIVFGAATDNVTNDPSAQFVHPVFGVL
jgi:hypothetical protein